MANDDAKALDIALLQPAPDANQHVGFGRTNPLGNQGKRPDEEGQAFLQNRNQPALRLANRRRRFNRPGGGDALLLFALQRETEVDVKLFEQRQGKQRIAGGLSMAPSVACKRPSLPAVTTNHRL